MQLLESALRLSVPMTFAALAGVLSERVGVINIALEGMLLGAAFAAMAVAHLTGNPWLGVGAAMLCGLALALLHAALVLRLRVDAVISGVGLNLLMMGLTAFLLRARFSPEGVPAEVKSPAPWFPQLAGAGPVGMLLGATTPFVPLAVLAVGLVWFLVHRTRAGLLLRAVGEGPHAARAAGVPVDRLRVLWLAAGGALAGLGGAYLSLDYAHHFTDNLSAGRGYLALAAVIFGRWYPAGAAASVLCFGLGEALQIYLQGKKLLGLAISSDLLSTFPYLLGLLALAGVLGRITPPRGLGQLE